MGGLSGAFGGAIAGAGPIFKSLGDGAFIARAMASATGQGALSALRGGKFGGAFLAAAVTGLIGGGLEHLGVDKVAQMVVNTATAGTVGAIGGGKFANAAIGAAFSGLVDVLADRGTPSSQGVSEADQATLLSDGGEDNCGGAGALCAQARRGGPPAQRGVDPLIQHQARQMIEQIRANNPGFRHEIVTNPGGGYGREDLLYLRGVLDAHASRPDLLSTNQGMQLHHVQPRFLGGGNNVVQIDSAYHQLITNAFRAATQNHTINATNSTPAQIRTIMDNVYSQYPIPKPR